jgi:hypothetical protein
MKAYSDEFRMNFRQLNRTMSFIILPRSKRPQSDASCNFVRSQAKRASYSLEGPARLAAKEFSGSLVLPR